MNSENFYFKLNKLINFFSDEGEYGYAFALAKNGATMKEVSELLIDRVKSDTGKQFKLVHFLATDELSFIGRIEAEHKKAPEISGLIFMGLDAWIKEGGNEALMEINFSRESLNALKMPLLFWLQPGTMHLISNWAVDLFTQRSLMTLEFDLEVEKSGVPINPLPMSEAPAHSMEVSPTEKKGLELRIGLLKKQLKEAKEAGISEKRIANELLLPLADTLRDMGAYEEALNYLNEYQEIVERNGLKVNLALAFSRRGEMETIFGNLDEALKYFEEFRNHMSSLYEAYPQNVSFKNGLAISYSKLGETHSSLGNLDEALKYFDDETELFEELYEAYPQNVSFKNGLAISYEKLGSTHSSLGNLDEALKYFDDETELFEELYEAYPQNVSFKNGLAISYAKLGDFYKVDKKEKAREYFTKGKILWSELVENFPSFAQFKQYLDLTNKRLEEL